MNCNDFIGDFMKKRARPADLLRLRPAGGDDFEAHYINNYVLPCLDGINPRDKEKHYLICGVSKHPAMPTRLHGRLYDAIWSALEKRHGPIDPHDFGLFFQEKWVVQCLGRAMAIERPTAIILDIPANRILTCLFSILNEKQPHNLLDRTEIIVVPTFLRAVLESPEFAALKALNESREFAELRHLIAKFEADFGPVKDRDDDLIDPDMIDPGHVVIGRHLGVTAMPLQEDGCAESETGKILLPVDRARRMVNILDGFITRAECLHKFNTAAAEREGLPEMPFDTDGEVQILELFLKLRETPVPTKDNPAYYEFCGNSIFSLESYRLIPMVRSIIGGSHYLMEAHNEATEILGELQQLRNENRPGNRLQQDVVSFGKVADLPALGAARARLTRLARRLRRPGTGATTGILLAGPPGTGKSLIARTIAAESGRAVFAETLSRASAGARYDDVIKNLMEIFTEAKKAAPAVIIIDEVDSFVERSMMHGDNAAYNTGIVNIALDLISSFRGDVAIIGTTNHPHMVDQALLRPGRLGERIDIDLPDAEGINELLRHYLPHMTDDQIRGAMLLMPQRPSQAAIAAMADEAMAQIEDELAAAEEAADAMKPDVAAGAAPSWRHVEAAITQMQGARRRRPTPGLA